MTDTNAYIYNTYDSSASSNRTISQIFVTRFRTEGGKVSETSIADCMANLFFPLPDGKVTTALSVLNKAHLESLLYFKINVHAL